VIVQRPGQADFAAQVGSSFELVDGSEHFSMKLASCEGQVGDERFEQFSLLFTALPGAPLRQGTYAVEHEALGSLLLFLVPVADSAEGVSYQAVFSHLTGEASK
jgi:hypothetical protein